MTSPVAVLRDARKSALLRTRLIDYIGTIRIAETMYYFRKASTATICMRAELSNWFTVGRPVLGSSNACPGL